jgi:DNA-binding beta-propeller fold protein YncE
MHFPHRGGLTIHNIETQDGDTTMKKTFLAHSRHAVARTLSGLTRTKMALLAVAVLASCGGDDDAKRDYLLASGRWDNTVILIDVEKALIAANDGTPNAVVNRLRVTPDIDANGTGKPDTVASGQPISVVISADEKRAYVSNHSGQSTPAQAASFQHGWPGTYTVLDLDKVVDPANNGTLNAVVAYIDGKNFGATGFAISPDQQYAAAAASETPDSEDGGRTIGIVDLRTNTVIRQVVQAYGKPGFPCPVTPPHASPNPSFGCFAGTNGVTFSPLGGGTLFTANGGTDDISVISLQKALAGDAGAELARIPVQTGGFGISTSPDGRLVVVASRESLATGKEGNTISIIDVEKALADPSKAEVARLQVGTDDPVVGTRPFAAAFTPDGKRIIVTHFRANNISVVDVAKALAGQPAEIKRLTLETPTGVPSRPRGIAFTRNGKYVAITGAPKAGPNTGVVWLIDLDTYAVAGRVTQVGNESYLMGAFRGK